MSHRIARLALIFCLFLATTSSVASAAAVKSTAVGTLPREIVYNAAAIKPFIDAAGTRRLDISGIGDSNQIAGPNGDYGWDHGYAKAWSDRYGWYATSLFGMHTNGPWNGGAGYFDSMGWPYGAQANGAPAALDKYKLTTAGFPPSYAYFAQGYVEDTAHWQPVMWVRKQSPIWGQTLTWNYTYGTFVGGTGGFLPTMSNAGQEIVTGKRVSTSTGGYGLVDGALRISPAGYQNLPDQLSFGFGVPRTSTTVGPFFGLWQRVTGDRPTGMSYSTTLGQGGKSLYNAAVSLKDQSDEALREYFRNLVRFQNATPMLLVNVIHGGNDGGATAMSVGPNPALSYTPAGFADNMEAVVQRYRTVWTSMGYDPKNLMFQYGPYTPVEGLAHDGTPRTRVQRLADWENAVMQLSQAHPEYNLAVVRGSRLTTPETMVGHNWYTSTTDHAHMSIDGYISIAELGVRQLTSYAKIDTLTNLSKITSLSFTFDSDVSALLSPDDLLLREIQSDRTIAATDLAVSWDFATKTATWTFQGLPIGALPVGKYEAKIAASLLAGSPASATAADSADYVFTFDAAAVPEPAAGALVMFAITALARRRR